MICRLKSLLAREDAGIYPHMTMKSFWMSLKKKVSVKEQKLKGTFWTLALHVKSLSELGLFLQNETYRKTDKKVRTLKTLMLRMCNDRSGEFTVGIPSKSGVGGGILSCVGRELESMDRHLTKKATAWRRIYKINLHILAPMQKKYKIKSFNATYTVFM